MRNHYYDRKKKDTVICLVGARSLLRPEKKKIQSSVWRVRNRYYDWKKKDAVVCLLGARFWQLRLEKKDTVVCLAGYAVVLFFVVAGNFDYDRKKKDTVVCWREIGSFLLWREIFITTGKKKDT